MSQCLFIGIRFISIFGNKKYRVEKPAESSRSHCLSSQISLQSPAWVLSSQISLLSAAWVYPKECNICRKFRVQHKGEKYKSYKIATYAAGNTIKAAAKDKNEKFYNGKFFIFILESQMIFVLSNDFSVLF